MPRLVVTLDGVTLREVPLVRERTTIGRRPHNDVVIDNLAVSGEHAVILIEAGGVVLEDLGSTNGTLLNGRPVQRAPLQHRDTIDIGKYRLRYVDEVPTADFEKTMVVLRPGAAQAAAQQALQQAIGSAGGPRPASLQAPPASERVTPASPPASPLPFAPAAAETAPPARIKVLTGGGAGREMALVKVVTTIGRPGGAVAAITRRGARYTLAHVEGGPVTRLNGAALGGDPVDLRAGDRLELAGVEMEFLLD